MGDGGTGVLGDELAGEAGGHAGDGAGDGFGGGGQGLVVALVGDEDRLLT